MLQHFLLTFKLQWMKALAPDDKVKGKGRRSYRQTVQSLLLIIIIIKVGYQIVKIWAFLFSPVTAKKFFFRRACDPQLPSCTALCWCSWSGLTVVGGFNMLLGILRHCHIKTLNMTVYTYTSSKTIYIFFIFFIFSQLQISVIFKAELTKNLYLLALYLHSKLLFVLMFDLCPHLYLHMAL